MMLRTSRIIFFKILLSESRSIVGMNGAIIASLSIRQNNDTYVGLDTNIKYRGFSTMKSAGRIRVVSHFMSQ